MTDPVNLQHQEEREQQFRRRQQLLVSVLIVVILLAAAIIGAVVGTQMEDPKEKAPLEGAKEPEDDFHKKISEKESEANEEKMAADSMTEVIEKMEPKEDKSAA